jgi:hypothetical protein
MEFIIFSKTDYLQLPLIFWLIIITENPKSPNTGNEQVQKHGISVAYSQQIITIQKHEN